MNTLSYINILHTFLRIRIIVSKTQFCFNFHYYIKHSSAKNLNNPTCEKPKSDVQELIWSDPDP